MNLKTYSDVTLYLASAHPMTITTTTPCTILAKLHITQYYTPYLVKLYWGIIVSETFRPWHWPSNLCRYLVMCNLSKYFISHIGGMGFRGWWGPRYSLFPMGKGSSCKSAYITDFFCWIHHSPRGGGQIPHFSHRQWEWPPRQGLMGLTVRFSYNTVLPIFIGLNV